MGITDYERGLIGELFRKANKLRGKAKLHAPILKAASRVPMLSQIGRVLEEAGITHVKPAELIKNIVVKARQVTPDNVRKFSSEKAAVSPDFVISRLGGIKGQIRRMGIPVQKGATPLTHQGPSGSPVLIRSQSPSHVGYMPSELKNVSGALQAGHSKFMAGMTPKEKEISGRLFLHHEKVEAREIKRLGPGKTFMGHRSPEVINRERRMVELIGKKYPRVAEEFSKARVADAAVSRTRGITPGERASEWREAYRRYGAGELASLRAAAPSLRRRAGLLPATAAPRIQAAPSPIPPQKVGSAPPTSSHHGDESDRRRGRIPVGELKDSTNPKLSGDEALWMLKWALSQRRA